MRNINFCFTLLLVYLGESPPGSPRSPLGPDRS